MVQAPADSRVIVAPDTVHTPEVVDAKFTASPEEALALSAGGVVPKAALGSAAKAMLWLPGVTGKLWLTGIAAAQFVLPAWVAWMVQAPADSSVIVEPDTVHTPEVVEAKPTARPEEAVALSAGGVVPKAAPESAAKAML